MDIEYLKSVVEGALLAAGAPLSLNQLNALFPDEEKPGHGPLKEALAALDSDLEGRAVELTEVGSGYRIQIRSKLMPVISQLWTEKPPRYSRALLETLAIIAYRQPITRGDIEQIRGVAVSSNILRTLQEREWIKVVGHRDVPGRPELLGTTKSFLDYFNLKSLDELPTLAEIKDIDNLEPELQLIHPNPPKADAETGGVSEGDGAAAPENEDGEPSSETQDSEHEAPEVEEDRPEEDPESDDSQAGAGDERDDGSADTPQPETGRDDEAEPRQDGKD
ncbi:SMC-Scp complex subunit ScpB [Wenzhouxiangella marina]|uniref:Segregation and condensation protein B n=1 Tax=Wenzhouxiangella marina TaxID=1579979 RepID=A0A0K0XWH8_9GAMM|nr:SMC-Scp complex subunit ScpB [Wenzhouxiangella marina]AKS42025.1 segregation and condensation protein B [Wenzhouxiangella marina]MBB6086207.1 segregation and condensation protein B [Wenzhouxiangella marina]